MGQANRLTPLKVEKTKKAGMYCDGAGLWLRVAAGGQSIGYCATWWTVSNTAWGWAATRT